MTLPIQSQEVSELVALVGVDPQQVLEKGRRLMTRGEKHCDNNYLMTLNLMAGASMGLKEFQKAHNYIDIGLRVDRNPHLLHTLAAIYYNEGELEKALTAATEATQQQGSEGEFIRTQALLLYELERFTEMRELLDGILSHEHFAGLKAMLIGGMASRTGNPEEARSNLNRAIQLEPTNPLYYLELAKHHQQMGQYQSVVDTLKRIDENQYPNQHYFVTLGNAYHELGFFDKAIDKLEQALQVNPLSLEAHLLLARIDQSKGKSKLGIKRLKSLLNAGLLVELQPRLLQQLGECYRSVGEYDEAFSQFKRAHGIERGELNNIEELLQKQQDSLNLARRSAQKAAVSSGGEGVIFVTGLPSLTLEGLATQLEATSNKIHRLGDGLLDEGTIPDQLEAGTYWHPHSLLVLPELLRCMPGAKTVLLLQHPKDVCLENTRRIIEEKTSWLNAAFYKWDNTVAYITMLLDLLSTVSSIHPPEDTISLEALANQDPDVLSQLAQAFNVDPSTLNVVDVFGSTQSGEWAKVSLESLPYTEQLDLACHHLGYVNV